MELQSVGKVARQLGGIEVKPRRVRACASTCGSWLQKSENVYSEKHVPSVAREL